MKKVTKGFVICEANGKYRCFGQVSGWRSIEVTDNIEDTTIYDSIGSASYGGGGHMYGTKIVAVKRTVEFEIGDAHEPIEIED